MRRLFVWPIPSFSFVTGTFVILGITGTAFVLFLILSRVLLPARLVPAPWRGSGPEWMAIAHDFDRDGTSEILEIRYEPAIKTVRLLLKRLNETVIVQYNIGVETSLLGTDKRFTFGDVTGDGIDDMVFFATREYRLGLIVINFYASNEQEAFQGYRVMDCMPCKEVQAPWEFYINDMQLADLDGDRRLELLFSLVTTGAVNRPRGVYRFDFAQGRLTHRFDTRQSCQGLDLWDIDNDDKLEVIVSTYASANFSGSDSLSDAYSWALVLDNTLQPLFPPRSFYGFTSYFYAAGYTEHRTRHSYVVGGIVTSGKAGEPTLLLKLNARGNVIQRRVLDHATGRLHIFRTSQDSLWIIWHAFEPVNQLERYDKQFRRLYVRSVDQGFVLMPRLFDMDGDAVPELIGFLPSQVQVYDRSLRLRARFEIRGHLLQAATTRFSPVSFGRLPKKRGILVSSLGRGSWLLIYEANPWYTYRWVGALALTVLVWLLVGFLYQQHREALWRRVRNAYVERFTPEAVFALDGRGRLLRANARALEQFNWSRVELLSYREAFQDFLPVVQLIEEAMQRRTSVTGSIMLRDSLHMVEILPLLEGSRLIGLLGRVYEASGRVPSDVRVWIHSVRKLVHDLRGALSNLGMGLRMLGKLQGDQQNEARVLIERLQREVAAMGDLTRSFLKQLNLEQPQFRIADIGEIVQRSVQRFAPFWNERLKVKVDVAPVPPFSMDPKQIQRALENLIENAIQAMEGQGELSISVRSVEDMFVPSGKACEIIITDTGHGIPKEQLRHIFEPGYTTREDGTGIGLTIVQKIIEQDHGGRISVSSIPGVSTTFELYIPIKT